MSTTSTLMVTERADATRFEAHLDGELVGFVDYIVLPGKVIATHPEIAEEHEGKGYGSQPVVGMVDQLRADGRPLQPLCPYVTDWLPRHPEVADVIDRSTPH